MNPIIDLITSKQFIATFVGLVVNILIAAAPGLEGIKAELITSITVIVGLLVAGVSYTDGQESRAIAARADADAAHAQRFSAAYAKSQYGQVAAPEAYTDNTRMIALLALVDALSGNDMDFAKARQRVHELIAAEARLNS